MPTGTPIPAETRAAILRDYVAGEKLDVIALVHGTHPRYVSHIAKSAGHAPRQVRGASRIKLEVARAAVDAYAAGEASVSVAERLSVSADTVIRLARDAGVPIRPRGGFRGGRR
jgi:hypothetical protein